MTTAPCCEAGWAEAGREVGAEGVLLGVGVRVGEEAEDPRLMAKTLRGDKGAKAAEGEGGKPSLLGCCGLLRAGEEERRGKVGAAAADADDAAAPAADAWPSSSPSSSTISRGGASAAATATAAALAAVEGVLAEAAAMAAAERGLTAPEAGRGGRVGDAKLARCGLSLELLPSPRAGSARNGEAVEGLLGCCCGDG